MCFDNLGLLLAASLNVMFKNNESFELFILFLISIRERLSIVTTCLTFNFLCLSMPVIFYPSLFYLSTISCNSVFSNVVK